MLQENGGILMKVCLVFTNRDKESIRDMYQDIACNLWEAWPSFKGECKTSTWVTRIALNVAGQEVRKRKCRPQFVVLDESSYEQLAAEACEQPSQRLHSIIDELKKADDKRMIYLYLEGMSLREIAEMNGISEDAVKQRIRRVKKKLAESAANE